MISNSPLIPSIRAHRICISAGPLSPVKPIIAKIQNSKSKTNQKPSDPRTIEEKQLDEIQYFEDIITDLDKMSVSKAIETNLCKFFHASKCIFWINRKKDKILYSETYKLIVKHEDSLPGFVLMNKSIIQIRKQNKNQFANFKNPFSFDNEKKETNFNRKSLTKSVRRSTTSLKTSQNEESPQFFFPIADNKEVYGVVQLIRNNSSDGFEREENRLASFFMDKFNIYGKHIFNKFQLHETSLQMFRFIKDKEDIISPIPIIKEMFSCKKVDIYQIDLLRGTFNYFNEGEKMMKPVANSSDLGIAGFCYESKTVVSEFDPAEHAYYNHDIDGEVKGPLLCVEDSSFSHECWIVCLRGGEQIYTTQDSLNLQSLSPFICKSIASFNEIKVEKSFNSRLTEILNFIPSLYKINDQNTLFKKVEDILKFLLESDKTIFYYYDKQDDDFKSKFSTSLLTDSISKETFELQSVSNESLCKQQILNCQVSKPNECLAGYIFNKKEVISLKDPQKNAMFDKEVDSYEGCENKPIIGTCVLDSNMHPIGVLTAIGPLLETFSENDQKLLQIFAHFIGEIIEQNESLQSSKKSLTQFKKLSKVPKISKEIIENTINCAMEASSIRRVTLFMVDEEEENINKSLKQIYSFGIKSDTGSKLSKLCFEKKMSLKFDRKMLADQHISSINNENESSHEQILSKILNQQKHKKSKHSNHRKSAIRNECQIQTNIKEIYIKTDPIFDEINKLCIGVVETEFFGEESILFNRTIDSITYLLLELNKIKEIDDQDALEQLSKSSFVTNPELTNAKSQTNSSLKPKDNSQSKDNQPKQILVSNETLFSLDFNPKTLTFNECFSLIIQIFDYFTITKEISKTDLSLFVDEVFIKPGQSLISVIDSFQGLAYMLKLSKDDAVIGKDFTFSLLLAVLLKAIDSIQCIKLLTQYKIYPKNLSNPKAIAEFYKKIMSIHQKISFQNFTKLQKYCHDQINSGTPESKMVTTLLLGAVSNCFIIVRSYFSEENFESLYNEFCKIPVENLLPKNEIYQHKILPIFSMLAKVSPALVSINKLATNNQIKVN